MCIPSSASRSCCPRARRPLRAVAGRWLRCALTSQATWAWQSGRVVAESWQRRALALQASWATRPGTPRVVTPMLHPAATLMACAADCSVTASLPEPVATRLACSSGFGASHFHLSGLQQGRWHSTTGGASSLVASRPSCARSNGFGNMRYTPERKHKRRHMVGCATRTRRPKDGSRLHSRLLTEQSSCQV